MIFSPKAKEQTVKSDCMEGLSVPEAMEAVIGERDFSAKNTASSDQRAVQQDDLYTKDTVPTVTGAKREGESETGIRLSWDSIDGVKGYKIYRSLTGDENSYSLFSTVSTNSVNIRNLKKGEKFYFKTAAYIVADEKSYEGEAEAFTCATTPESLESITVTHQDKNSTALEWQPVKNIDGYLLERCFSGKWSEYQTFDKDTTGFTDTELKAGKAYYYRLTAFREDSTGRLYSDSVTAYTVAGLLGPEDSGSASKLGRVSLDYKKSAYADGYLIYYSDDGESFEELADTDKTHYSTSRLEDGTTYFFRIYPYRQIGDRQITGTFTELSFEAKTEIYGKTVGDTYVEVSLSDQHVWYIVDGDVFLESDCVTGNYGSADTPKGFFSVNNKASPCVLKGEDYETTVTYWMAFIGGGWGLHDASWRSSFGGSIYKGDGSHGCVNLPSAVAKKMYANISVGTPVIVY